MKKLPLFLFGLLASTAALEAATYTFNTETGGSGKNWSTPAAWLGAPSTLPITSADEVVYNAVASSYRLLLDREETHIKSFSVIGLGTSSQRLASAVENASITIDHFSNTSSALINLANGSSSKLSVSIGTFEIGAGATVEIGHPDLNSLEAFTVTGTSTIGGLLYFDGVKSRAEGENKIKLGHVTLSGTGSMIFGNRGNTGGVLSLSSLNGDSASLITLVNADGYAGTGGELEIDSASGTVSTFNGRIRLTSRSEATTAQFSLVKKGSGTQIFTNAGQTYNGGTTIEGGILAITNATGSGLGTGEVTVKNGGTLAGSGILALQKSIIVENGGSVASSAHLESGFAELNLRGINLVSGPILKMEEGSSFKFRFATGGLSDSIKFNNYQANLFILDSHGIVVNAEGLAEGTYTLFTFNSITNGELLDISALLRVGSGFNGYEAIFRPGTNAILMDVTAVPEPGSVALGISGLAGLSILRRLKR